jgi:hypothetical protein
LYFLIYFEDHLLYCWKFMIGVMLGVWIGSISCKDGVPRHRVFALVIRLKQKLYKMCNSPFVSTLYITENLVLFVHF